MTRRNIEQEYFEWMYHLVCDEEFSYRKLMWHLYSVDFTYIINLDKNRASDGMDLRYRFGYLLGIDKGTIVDYIDYRPCSVLEMMIALSIRCEEHIMADPDIGDRVGQWFWNMIVNLGLGSMNDTKYDEAYVDEVINRLLNRKYKANGEGGLFTLNNCEADLRTVDIWYQMSWYLKESLYSKES